MLCQQVTAQTVNASLVSVGDLKYTGNPDWDGDFQLLTSRTQYQTATPGSTTFAGSINVLGSIVVGALTSPTSSFTSTVTVTGSIIAPQGTCAMLSGASNSYAGLQLLSPSTTATALSLIWGRANSANNIGVLQWDVTNTRAVIGVAQAGNFIQINSTAVNHNGIALNAAGGVYLPIRNATSVAFTLTAGQTSTAVTIPTTNYREVFITIRSCSYSVLGLPLSLQCGQGTSYLSAAGSYQGISEGTSNNTIWASGVGIDIHDQITAISEPVTTTMKLTLAGVVGGQQAWTVWIQSAGDANLEYSAGSGIVMFQAATITTLSSVRLKNTTGTCTGTLSVSYI